MAQGAELPAPLTAVSFAELDGWDRDDHAAALGAFRRHCLPGGGNPAFSAPAPSDPGAICRAAAEAGTSAAAARRFFETWFTPVRIGQDGFVTGYYEPELPAARTRTDRFFVPLLRKPEGLVPVGADNRPPDWPDTLSHGRRVGRGLVELPDRGAIMDGALDGEGLELVWLEDPVEAFLVHVQGSARLRLDDGAVMRVGYAGKTGHPYTGIARLLVDRGEGTPADFTLKGLRAWLKAHPEERDTLLRANRSYIFFREISDIDADAGPVGAAGLPLVAGRSLAVDPAHLAYGSLVFVSAAFDDPDRAGRFARLMIADDTGSAIRGPARGDIFVGSGERAGAIAGEIRHRAVFTVLVPSAALARTKAPD